MTITTTLNDIRDHHALRHRSWSKLLRHLGKTAPDNESLPLLTILESNGLDDTIQCLRAVSGHDREIRLYAIWCARQVQHLMTDQRSLAVAELYTSDEELVAARRRIKVRRTNNVVIDAANAAGRATVKADPVEAIIGAVRSVRAVIKKNARTIEALNNTRTVMSTELTRHLSNLTD